MQQDKSAFEKYMAMNINDVVVEFNGDLIWLSALMEKRQPNDKRMAGKTDKIKAAKNTDFLVLINEAGPYLHKYSDNLRKNDYTIFDENLILTETAARDKGNKNGNEVMGIFAVCRGEYDKMKPGEQKIIHTKINNLLDLYLTYLVKKSN